MQREQNKNLFESIWDEPPRYQRPVDLDRLADGIKMLPPSYWKERMFFFAASDRRLKAATKAFPARINRHRGTHPLFVMRVIPEVGSRLCPCSTKCWYVKRFISKGCRLEITGKVTDRDSYLVEDLSFILPQDPAFWKPLRFAGRVPEACIEKVPRP